MIIAGETSGDQHGAKLVREMHEADGSIVFYGIGGQALKRAGVHILVDASTLSVVGITEVFARIPDLFRGLSLAKQSLARLQPNLLILIDFPDFNLNVALRAKKLRIPVLYYISPQIWAWRPGRVKKIGRRVDHVAVILPFEEEFYRKHHIPVTFVGHPLVDSVLPSSEAIPSDGEGGSVVIGLLPGSRNREIVQHLPIMLESAGLLENRVGAIKIIVSQAPSVAGDLISGIIRKSAVSESVELSDDPIYEVLKRCRMVIAASGTVTLQATLSGTPMVIIYRVSAVSFRLAKALVRVRFAGLANLIAGREVVPELIQDDATPEKIASKAYDLLRDPDRLEHMRRQMLAVRKKLGVPGASVRVARIALSMMNPFAK